MNLTELTKEIINGRRLTRDDDLSFFETADLTELAAGANEIRQALCGNSVDLCTIINGRAGKCSENCKFCAQSSFHILPVKRMACWTLMSFLQTAVPEKLPACMHTPSSQQEERWKAKIWKN